LTEVGVDYNDLFFWPAQPQRLLPQSILALCALLMLQYLPGSGLPDIKIRIPFSMYSLNLVWASIMTLLLADGFRESSPRSVAPGHCRKEYLSPPPHRRTDVYRWSFAAWAGLYPALHALTLKKSTSRTTSASVEHAPAQLLVENRQIGMQRNIGASGCQRCFFSC